MQKFIAIYLAPAAILDEWMKTDPEIRKSEEKKMEQEWNEWMDAHRSALTGITAGLGKTKRITTDGVTDTKNDIMMYSIVEAASPDAAAELFVGHPHFGIPGASIEIMPINPLPGMEGL
ncbi:hypothetical protein GW943_02010 [Candidatus Parcubacteria bacterium]|uniref:YCII-related domain-containing protein n=1 Tax=Candidatus Kaiserbacteria bacterium CG10_big_fil_rev_8_21_14_0_10_47_16 TaxID=1974608 RepID=A0A2H0UEF2_9BACT|nr:hypothetical protein [Candidatus Parcubacteria bacterium]PIR84804.1 MAG: hypothetical protein COU16_01300 [Candidatus Kaiserbacteria bacterium CG10_big_fil_rev_8_21_14_0_10_47_16]